jgi:hypothetical protein
MSIFLMPKGVVQVCWWEEPLLVALKHSEGIKHTVLLQETNSLQTQKA